MANRKITRFALLQNYCGHSERLADDMPEVAEKGYYGVFLWATIGEEERVRPLCETAASLGLKVALGTGYMKYQYKYLAEHPEQRLVQVHELADQDGIATVNWGCPFNPEFKARYFDFLREISEWPNVARIFLNDEADLRGACYCPTCRHAYKDKFGDDMPVNPNPKTEDWQDENWRRFLKWRIDRWTDVHGQMADVIHRINPEIQVLFQANPTSDMWRNPWDHCVDLAAMAERLDGLSTDPYYTFHRRQFDPPEVYLSEWCRYLAGIMPEGKTAEIIPQAFSHPTFTRPLGEPDGYWAALVPPACGIDAISPYTYNLQRISPMVKTYERCFEFDRCFERARPLKYAAVVNGSQTKTYLRPLPLETPASYDGTRLLRVTEALRHKAVPYTFFPDRRLDHPDSLGDYKVLVLPEINCLSDAQADGIRRLADEGKNLVILGQLGIADESGRQRQGSLLEEITGIRVIEETAESRRFRLKSPHPCSETLKPFDDEAARDYSEGVNAPLYKLEQCVNAEAPGDVDIVAEFTDAHDNPTCRPAIIHARRRGNILWFAGFPSRRTQNQLYNTYVLNWGHYLFAAAVEWAAGALPALRVEDWPPDVPMRRVRPIDHRFMPTYEFFPLAADDLFIAVVTSYFREPSTFPMVLDVPEGKDLRSVTEVIGNTEVAFDRNARSVKIAVEVGPDTAALMYVFAVE